ncbi:UNVERIFIED_CONTAM: YD repeat-containing protein [Acetivibrio alkalicellulosi]
MLAKVIDPEVAQIGGNTTKYEYDGLRRLSVKTSLNGNTIANGHPEGIFYSKTAYDYECAKQSLAISVGESPTWEKASHHSLL